MIYSTVVRLLSGEFDTFWCSKHKLEQRRDEKAKISHGFVASFIIGIYY